MIRLFFCRRAGPDLCVMLGIILRTAHVAGVGQAIAEEEEEISQIFLSAGRRVSRQYLSLFPRSLYLMPAVQFVGILSSITAIAMAAPFSLMSLALLGPSTHAQITAQGVFRSQS